MSSVNNNWYQPNRPTHYPQYVNKGNEVVPVPPLSNGQPFLDPDFIPYAAITYTPATNKDKADTVYAIKLHALRFTLDNGKLLFIHQEFKRFLQEKLNNNLPIGPIGKERIVHIPTPTYSDPPEVQRAFAAAIMNEGLQNALKKYGFFVPQFYSALPGFKYPEYLFKIGSPF